MGGDWIRPGLFANGKLEDGAVITFANGLTPGPKDKLRSDEAEAEVLDADLESVMSTVLGGDCEGGPVVFGVSGVCPVANSAGDINDGWATAVATGTAGTGATTGAGTGSGTSAGSSTGVPGQILL